MAPLRIVLVVLPVACCIVGCTRGGTAQSDPVQSDSAGGVVAAPPRVAFTDWTQFGYDVGRSSASTSPTAITAANADSLRRQQVSLPGTVDASAIFLHGVTVRGSAHDALFVTTTYGKTVALDAASGAVLWTYTPASYEALAGSRQITTSTPVADPDRQFIYASSPDGQVRKLAINDGHVVWSTAITKLPTREKIASPLGYYHGRVIATTGGYIGDAPPYQGHVVELDAATGALLHVWNSLCSDRQELIDPSTCNASDSAIWGRAGAVVDAATGNIFVATGNGPWDGVTDWGDAVLELSPDATQLLGNFTPSNTDELNSTDADLGSTSPVLLGHGLVAQGGKDGKIRLLGVSTMSGPVSHKDGELQVVSTPSGSDLFTAPAVWHDGAATWMFVADGGGTQAWEVSGDRLVARWKNSHGGTSPVIAGGLLYVYDPAGHLRIYTPATGDEVATLYCGAGHWNSPIVLAGMVVLPAGSANRHATDGVLNIWRLP
jgi:outer membrane protein assembly factor BamB